jgi:hypothetical protein
MDFDIPRIEGETVLTLAHQVGRAATAGGHKNRQAAGHRFIDHQAPRLRGAGENEGVGQRVVERQVGILRKTGPMHALFQAQVAGQALQGFPAFAITTHHQVRAWGARLTYCA